MTNRDIVVWLNTEEAHLYLFDKKEVELVITNPDYDNSIGDFHSQAQFHGFFHEIFNTLEHANRILLVGPGSTKTHLIRHALKHELHIEQKIVGIETLQTPYPSELHHLAESNFN